ncbi:putative holin-like toxin [Tepidibacillus sp. HK-1]|uniref:putative holin-like toxin n=1 Tax=Tepidibacillus sp. HK-1 TaxID=1883407 RepID=UPI000A7DC045|nr:putative holin-like toxin [Tepidibacillus sp. HK-1]
MRIKIEVVNSVFNSYSSPFDRLSQRDLQNFANIGEQLFLLYDEGYITVGEIILLHRIGYQGRLAHLQRGGDAMEVKDALILMFMFGMFILALLSYLKNK